MPGVCDVPCWRGRPLHAIVFDLDGTLIDSLPDIRHALNSALRAYDRLPLELNAVAKMVGDGIPKLVERGFAASGGVPEKTILDEAVDVCLAAYEARPAVETRAFPDVPETLATFHGSGLRLAICSNKTEKLSRLILESLGLAGYFGAILGGDSLPQRKPDPAPVLACLDGLKVGAADALYVGDHRNDLLAARAAGVPVVLLDREDGTSSVRDLDADEILADVAELCELLYKDAA
jgi:phosphoglycolate phosphatase